MTKRRSLAKTRGRASLAMMGLILGLVACHEQAQEQEAKPSEPACAPGTCFGPAYPGMPSLAPPIVRSSYFSVPDDAKGPPIDPQKGYAAQDLGSGAHVVTNGSYQMLVVVHDQGIVLLDAPPPIGDKIFDAVASIAPGKPITHLVYSHAHFDHVGHAGEVKRRHPGVVIVAHEETRKLLARANDPKRPVPTETFASIGETYTLNAGNQSLALRYPGPNHQPGNIEIFHAASKTLMLIDVVFPGWMMWRRLALAQDVRGLFEVIKNLNTTYDFRTLVAGHVGRTGTKADVTNQLEFLTDLHAAAAQSLGEHTPGALLTPADQTNPWAIFDSYIDQVVVSCVNKLTPKWSSRLAGYDVFIYDQCMAMEQSIRIDGPSL